MKRALLVVLVVVGSVWAVPGAGAGAGAYPLDTDGHGIWASVRFGRLVVTFDGRATRTFQRLRGRLVDVACGRVSPIADSPLLNVSGDLETETVVPRRRVALRTGLRPAGQDVCELNALSPNAAESTVALIPLTNRGFAYVAQQTATANVSVFTFFTLAYVFRHERTILRSSHAVRLAYEGEDPPGTRLGIYDTPDHLWVAQRDATGLLLFFQRDGSVIRTNVEPPVAAEFGRRSPA